MSCADALKFSFIHPESPIINRLLLINESSIVTNRAIIKCMAEVILLCGKQCISLCGHRYDNTAEPDTNKGNFLAILEYSAKSGKIDLDIQNCRGQGYDGASNMSSARGVQGRLLAENPKAMYIQCNSHVLNLCIVEACNKRMSQGFLS